MGRRRTLRCWWSLCLSGLGVVNGQGIAEILSRKQIVDSKDDPFPKWLSLTNTEILLFVVLVLACIWFLVRRSIHCTPPAEIERMPLSEEQSISSSTALFPLAELPLAFRTAHTGSHSSVPSGRPPLIIQSEEDGLLTVSSHSYGSADSPVAEFRSLFSTKLPTIEEVQA
jgi:hypothetical protein